jgi:hypothetical protein
MTACGRTQHQLAQMSNTRRRASRHPSAPPFTHSTEVLSSRKPRSTVWPTSGLTKSGSLSDLVWPLSSSRIAAHDVLIFANSASTAAWSCFASNSAAAVAVSARPAVRPGGGLHTDGALPERLVPALAEERQERGPDLAHLADDGHLLGGKRGGHRGSYTARGKRRGGTRAVGSLTERAPATTLPITSDSSKIATCQDSVLLANGDHRQTRTHRPIWRVLWKHCSGDSHRRDRPIHCMYVCDLAVTRLTITSYAVSWSSARHKSPACQALITSSSQLPTASTSIHFSPKPPPLCECRCPRAPIYDD